MIRLIGAVALATLSAGSIARASVDTTPEKTIYVSCETVRSLVASYGMDAVAVLALAQGVSERNIAVLARRCLR